jgi:hypothetical protein
MLKGSMSTEGETLHVTVARYVHCWLFLGAPDKLLAHARQSLPMAPAGLYVSQPTVSHCAAISCTALELFCQWVVLCGTRSKPTFARSQLISFGTFQDRTFVIPFPCHVSSPLPPSNETCRYAMVPSAQKNLERFST